MAFSSFDAKHRDRYAKDAKEKWGNTEAYQEFERKTAGKDMQATGDQLMEIFKAFGQIRHLSPTSEQAQELVSKLQRFISENYYQCTNQILFGLGQMYAAPGQMNESIDKAGGDGTGSFACQAIMVYCS